MIRSLFILFFFFAIHDTSYSQKTKKRKTTPAIITKTVENNKNPFKDSLFLKDLAKLYGDSILVIVDSLLKDSAIINLTENTSLWNCGEFVSSQYKIPFPIKPLGWTNDYENIFTKGQIAELDSIISKFEKETTNEIAILTIDSSWTKEENFNSFILSIANYWGVGNRNINNGILIGFSNGLKKIRIENGYGIEGRLSDNETQKIIDEIIVPEFKKGNCFDGIKKGLVTIMQKIR